MRLRLRLSASHGLVPFDYQHRLTSRFWQWLGPSDDHDDTSLYSLSFLSGGRATRTRNDRPMLDFPDGATWTVSAPFPDLHRRLMQGVFQDPVLDWGMRVEEIHDEPLPALGVMQRFRVNGAVLVRAEREDGTQEHLTWDDPAADEALTRVFRWKLHLAGRDDLVETAQMRFDRDYPKARTKLVSIKGLKYRCNECPVLVMGEPEAVLFAYLVGAGELTGSCLGALTL